MTDEIQNQIIELETKLLFQDDVIQKLDDELIQQGEIVDILSRRLAMLEEKVKELSSEQDNPTSITEEKPPHY